MAIEKSWKYGEEIFTPVCDGCGDELTYEYDFYDAVEAKKLAGWRSKKIGDEWQDFCPECQERFCHETAVGDFAGIGRL